MAKWRVRLDATPYVNIRLTPAPDGAKIDRGEPGELVEVIQINDDTGWAEVRITAYMMARFLEEVKQQTGNFRKISMHIHTGSNADACIKGYGDCYKAGTPIPLAVVINSPWIVNAIREVSPPTYIVYRGGVVGGPDVLPLTRNNRAANVAAGKKRFYERYAPCAANAYQCANEHYSKDQPDWMITAMGEFYEGVMDGANEKNVDATTFDLSTGTMEKHHLKLVAPALRRAEAEGHPFNYHAYAPPDVYDMTSAAEWFVMRWVWMLEDYPKMRVLFGEAGGYHNNGPDPMALFRQLQAMLATNENVIGAAGFTFDAGEPWKSNGFNLDPILNAYIDWHKSL